jgi:hypothetical protein
MNRRGEPVRWRQVRLPGAVRDRSLRHRQVRVRPRVRGRDEARLRQGWHHLRLTLRAQEAGLPHQDEPRARLHGCLRLQGPLLREGLHARVGRATSQRLLILLGLPIAPPNWGIGGGRRAG